MIDVPAIAVRPAVPPPISSPIPLPEPRAAVAVRPGAPADLPFIDALQKRHGKQVGWMPTTTLEGKIKLGHVLVAESGGDRVGYCIGSDQYFKRDDVGIIYQMNVVPGRQRGLVGVSLLKAQFERSAYGCKLYCCWCAQDIAANRFWEAMGFVPLAFRAGSEKRSRVHIFWQKRIRAGDVTTPWWFPSKTAGGSIREDRIVLPIPPGTHWSDAKPLIFPESPVLPEPSAASVKAAEKPPGRRARAGETKPAVETPVPVRRNGLMFDIPQPGEPLPEAKPAAEPKPKVAKGPKDKRACDPRLAAAARELRDRWLERVNGQGSDATPLLPTGKYDVSRRIDARARIEVAEPMKRLAA